MCKQLIIFFLGSFLIFLYCIMLMLIPFIISSFDSFDNNSFGKFFVNIFMLSPIISTIQTFYGALMFNTLTIVIATLYIPILLGCVIMCNLEYVKDFTF